MECFRATDSFLHGYDLVMNREYTGQAFVATAVMASSPKLHFWRDVFTALQVRIQLARVPLGRDINSKAMSNIKMTVPLTIVSGTHLKLAVRVSSVDRGY